MRFVKMHGIGNDYVYIDAVTTPALERLPDWPRRARAMSDRHRGIGGDGVILLCPARTDGAHVRMRIFNADGSEAEMCGNGIRCVARFAHDRLGIVARPTLVETGRGVLAVDTVVRDGRVRTAAVDMGRPILDPGAFPVDARHAAFSEPEGEVLLELPGPHPQRVRASLVSMGNPHAVLFAEHNEAIFNRPLAAIPLEAIGPRIERHPAFPRRVNVHLAEVRSRHEVVMRTWERGAGLTQACGTGACAVAVAGIRAHRLESPVLAVLPGGALEIRWAGSDTGVVMSGPAEEVFSGEWPDDEP